MIKAQVKNGGADYAADDSFQAKSATFVSGTESASRHMSNTSISNTAADAPPAKNNNAALGSIYDVRAEGSIINIKHN